MMMTFIVNCLCMGMQILAVIYNLLCNFVSQYLFVYCIALQHLILHICARGSYSIGYNIIVMHTVII